jgi:membrane protease YdiL (CAAX protease family)
MHPTETLAPSISAVPLDRALTASWRQCLIATALVLLLVLAGQSFADGVVEFAITNLTSVNPAFIRFSAPAISTAYQMLLFWLIIGWMVGPARTSRLALYWPRLKIWHWIAIVVGVYALKAVVSIAVVATVQAMGGDPAARAMGGAVQAVAPIGAVMRSPVWPVLLLAGLLAAVAEELVYRGYLSKTLEASPLGFWAGATVAAIIWAGLHLYYPWGIQLVLVAVGVALSWVRARTGSVYPGIIWHMLNNAVGLLALRLIA